jgi:hypothetical protein
MNRYDWQQQTSQEVEMERIEVLKTLLQLTEDAEELAPVALGSEHLRSLIGEIRRKAKEEHDRLRQVRRPIESRYQLCMIGILEESDFGKASWQNLTDLDARLRRIHEENDRTIKKAKAERVIM